MSNQPQAHVADERAAFEAWHTPKFGKPVRLGDSDQYQVNSVQGKWQTWQAARAAIPAGANVAAEDRTILIDAIRHLGEALLMARNMVGHPDNVALINRAIALAGIRSPRVADMPAETPKPVGEAGVMPGTSGFTMACFKAVDVPLGTKLYAAQPAPASATDARELIYELVQQGQVSVSTADDFSLDDILALAKKYPDSQVFQVTRLEVTDAVMRGLISPLEAG